MLDYNALQTYYKIHRANYPENFRLRIHRSLSWLKKAEGETDFDMKFISLWIAFNAAYAREIENMDNTDGATLKEFLLRIYMLDEKEHHIYYIFWKKFSQSIRLLLDNKYVSSVFWDFHNQRITEKEYLIKEMQEREKVLSSLENQNTGRLLEVLFRRLYTLRNQILHGGATYGSSANRSQIRDACDILQSFIPTMLQIMMENHNEMDWGKPFYPYIKE